MDEIPFVSIVTPVFNGARYLAECIESVLAQTTSEWEYIIVDNQSQDGSLEIAQRYAALDGRIRVIRPDDFVNVQRNFNRAARLISPRSRYCKFLCADDWLYPECLQRMVAVAERHPTVGVVSSFRRLSDQVDQDGLVPYTQEVLPGTAVVRNALLSGPFVTGSQSQLLYRADLIRREACFFDESVWHTDTDAVLRTLLKSDFGFVHQVLTFTRLHPDSLTASFAYRINTFLPMEVRQLIRYGSQVLSEQEYRTTLHRWVRRYAWWLLKQSVKPSRLRNVTYQTYHRGEISRMLDELRNDRETQIMLKLSRRLLRNLESAEPLPQLSTSAAVARRSE